MLTDCKIHRPAQSFFLQPRFSCLRLSRFRCLLSAPSSPVSSRLHCCRVSPSIYTIPAARSLIQGLTCCQVLPCMLDPLPGAPPSVCGKEDIHVNETHHESIQPHFGHAYFEGHFNEEKNERHSFQSNYAHSLPESREENMKLFDDQLVSTQLANVQLSVPSSQVLSNASFCFSNQVGEILFTYS
ncbi:hypothetical protein TNCT_293731 [Trichonephila clavata]|uniref:Uncharacterized protein n=1 Tax=Trichonephila clavata TaxID=2740835 RepID=A0A8X6K6W3_TRICU|nr:hypothetical protein TNCT_293731 [Trichonephila clavata]